MNSDMKKKPFTIYLLAVLLGIQSVGGLGGGLALTLSPSGAFMHMPLSALNGSPFSNFFIPGLILLSLLGILPGILAYAVVGQPMWSQTGYFNIYRNVHWSWTYSLYTGIMLTIWILVEIRWISYDILQTIYGLIGVLLIILTLLPANMKYAGWK
jgi:hypothetical protein